MTNFFTNETSFISMSCEILENFLRILFHNFSVPSRRQKHAKSSSGKKAFSIFVTTNSPFLTHKMSALGRPWRASLQAGRPRRQRILYTGTNPAKFKALGDILPFPMIQISPAKLKKAEKKKLLTNLPHYDIILFTSRFAVQYFFEILKEEHYPLPRLREKTFAAIGRETAQELVEQRIRNVLTAPEETSQGLFKAMLKRVNLQGKRILFPRSSLPNPYLKERLTAQGSRVEELTIYRNTKPAKRPLPKKDIGQVLFTSPSTARNFLKDYGAIPREWRILSRGPKTSEYLKKAGYSHIQKMDVINGVPDAWRPAEAPVKK